MHSLEYLAERADFENVNDSLIHIKGRRLRDFFKGKLYVFYKVTGGSGTLFELAADMEVIAFDDSTDYSTAVRYHIAGTLIEDAWFDKNTIDLTKKGPTHTGEDVVELLVKYINGES